MIIIIACRIEPNILLGGVLEKAGYLKALVEGFLRNVKTISRPILLVISTTILGNAVMGEVYLAIILNGSLYKNAFKGKGFRPSMLSRLLEEGGTLTGVMIPWTTTGVSMTAILGVPTFSYFEFAFLSITNLILSIILFFWEYLYKKLKKGRQ